MSTETPRSTDADPAAAAQNLISINDPLTVRRDGEIIVCEVEYSYVLENIPGGGISAMTAASEFRRPVQ